MLEMTNQTGQFINLNLRPEKHGDENVPGADLKISVTTGNDILAEFHPTLKSMLFRVPEPDEQDLVDQTHEAPPKRACASATRCTASNGITRSSAPRSSCTTARAARATSSSRTARSTGLYWKPWKAALS